VRVNAKTGCGPVYRKLRIFEALNLSIKTVGRSGADRPAPSACPDSRANRGGFCDDGDPGSNVGSESEHGPAGPVDRKEQTLAGNKRPSFLKRQKEQARLARANEKREMRRARRLAKSESTELQEPEEFEVLDGPPDPMEDEQDSTV
jgi:hypothetical protein